MFWRGTPWVTSTIRAAGASRRMTPFMMPTNGSTSPKSVVNVTTGPPPTSAVELTEAAARPRRVLRAVIARLLLRAAIARLLLRAPIQRGVHELTDHVPDQDVRLLDARGLAARGDVQPVVDHRAKLA